MAGSDRALGRFACAGFCLAGRFLSRLPFPDCPRFDPQEQARAALYYPLVGLLLGGLLLALATLLRAWLALDSVGAGSGGADAVALAALSGALLLFAWVWLTGGLHLDGLADSADAWVGGLGDRARSLAIMKDPRVGVMAVLALVLVLLCQWAALWVLLMGEDFALLLWVPVWARVGLVVLFLTTPYVREQGVGGLIRSGLSRPRFAGWVLLLGLVCVAHFVWLGRGLALLVMALLSLAVFVVWRRAMLKRLGGTTGDTAGAMVVWLELGMLLAVALV